MNKYEKTAQIQHMSLKFYEMSANPSLLLRSEAQNPAFDEEMLKKIAKLEKLESKRNRLEQTYSETLIYEFKILKKQFEYEYDQLRMNQEQECVSLPMNDPFRNQKLEALRTKHQRQIERFQTDWRTRKNETDKRLRAKLTVCEQKIRSVFMDAVNYLYR